MLLSEVEQDGDYYYPHTADRYRIDSDVLPSGSCYELTPPAVSRAPEVQYHFNATLPAQGINLIRRYHPRASGLREVIEWIEGLFCDRA
jgi:hypothetical protein